MKNTPGFTTSMMGYTGFRLSRPYVQRRKLYFGHDSTTLNAWYQPDQLRVDNLLQAQRYGSAA